MRPTLKISEALKLPLDAVTEKLAFLGRTSGGKTYAATKLCEEMLEANAHVVALDPVGKWHGLRLAKDGKSKGYPIPVFGGLFGDVPLEPTAGALVADLIVDKKINAVIDVSQFILSEQTRFAYDFATRFYQRQKAEPSAVHLFIEECQEFIPQNLPGGSDKFEARMLHAFERMWKLGRNAGIGGSLISQRPQEINKKVLNMSECLFVFQMTGPQEKKAIKAYVGEKGLDESMVDTLPYLKQGNCHVWSPVWLDKSEVIHIAEKRTLDASATPKVGARIVTPKELSPIDVEQIREAMTVVVERAKENDPRELKKQNVTLARRITDLEKQLASPVKAQPAVERVEVPVLADDEVARLEDLVTELARIKSDFHRDQERFVEAWADVSRSVERDTALIIAEIAKTKVSPVQPRRVVYADPQRPAVSHPLPTPPVQSANGSGVQLSKAGRAILTTLAQHPAGLTKKQILIFAGYRQSGDISKLFAEFVREGIAVADAGRLVITAAGLEALGPFEALPEGVELRARILQDAGGGAERALLSVLFDAHPQSIAKGAMLETAGYKQSGDISKMFAKWVAIGYATKSGMGHLRASNDLFD